MGFKSRYSIWQRRAIKALEGSIEHWERIASNSRYKNESVGHDYCQCCIEFLAEAEFAICARCPIFIRTGETTCKGTPYLSAARAFNGFLPHEEIKTKFDKEVKFLRDTLEMVKTGIVNIERKK